MVYFNFATKGSSTAITLIKDESVRYRTGQRHRGPPAVPKTTTCQKIPTAVSGYCPHLRADTYRSLPFVNASRSSWRTRQVASNRTGSTVRAQ